MTESKSVFMALSVDEVKQLLGLPKRAEVTRMEVKLSQYDSLPKGLELSVRLSLRTKKLQRQ